MQEDFGGVSPHWAYAVELAQTLNPVARIRIPASHKIRENIRDIRDLQVFETLPGSRNFVGNVTPI
jgi:hypothetical protein